MFFSFVPSCFTQSLLFSVLVTSPLAVTAQTLSRAERLASAPTMAAAPTLPPSDRADSIIIRRIFDEALAHGKSYDNLRVLCKEVGPRLSGSPQGAQAVEWG